MGMGWDGDRDEIDPRVLWPCGLWIDCGLWIHLDCGTKYVL